MNTALTRYGAALLPLAVLILGVLDAANTAGTNLFGWQTITQLVLLVATTGAAFWLPLVPGKWAGALKTGAAVVGAIVSALVAVVPDGHFTRTTIILFITAAVKAVAVQIGVTIRAAETGASVALPKNDAVNLNLTEFATHTVTESGVLTAVPVGSQESDQSGTRPEHRADTSA